MWVYPLIPAVGRSFEEGNNESDLIHVSSKGASLIVDLGFYIVDKSLQVLWVSLERFDIKLVWPFLAPTLLQ